MCIKTYKYKGKWTKNGSLQLFGVIKVTESAENQIHLKRWLKIPFVAALLWIHNLDKALVWITTFQINFRTWGFHRLYLSQYGAIGYLGESWKAVLLWSSKNVLKTMTLHFWGWVDNNWISIYHYLLSMLVAEICEHWLKLVMTRENKGK